MSTRRAALSAALAIAVSQVGAAAAQDFPGPVVLRLTADSGVVGHYKLTTREDHELAFDIPSDDPRAELLRSAAAPRRRNTEIAVTIVTAPDSSSADRRYILYWLGYRLSGGEVRTLTSLQWDSIFRASGRRATLHISPRGEPRGIEVGADAVRPVGDAMAGMLSAVALGLPSDSVNVGDSWEAQVSLPVRRPDGQRVRVPIKVTYRLRALRPEPEGLIALIEFDGAPSLADIGAEEVTGRYFGESAFAVAQGRYESLIAASRLEVTWIDSGGLPPSRSILEWEAEVNRSGGDE